ncbi:uncharacterized protein LOC143245555 [Tachypleus tridentatus]|uniref:uncharacterized protein LOC143245555 n=1 Tax=Tachypleus tridentatus TaxID=6853 RepID=UPI003FD286A4
MSLLKLPELPEVKSRSRSSSNCTWASESSRQSRSSLLEDNGRDENIPLEDRFEPRHLYRLRACFFDPSLLPKTSANRRITQHRSRSPPLPLESFVLAVNRVMGSKRYQKAAIRFFHQVEEFSDRESFITWEDVLDYLQQRMKKAEPWLIPPLSTNYEYKYFPHTKTEYVAKIILIPPPSKVYIVVGKLGNVGITEQNLKLQNQYDLDIEDRLMTTDGTASSKRFTPASVTDAVYMSTCKFYAVSTTNSCIHFIDISASTHVEVFRLYGLPQVPLCMDYWVRKEDNGEARLLTGSGNGNVVIFFFLQPMTSLFYRQNMEGVERISFSDLDKYHRKYTTIRVLEGVHKTSIYRLIYNAENEKIITCAQDSQRSLVMQDVWNKNKPYIFSILKGIRCFDYTSRLDVLATGSPDFIVRLWNPYVSSRATAILRGHVTAVIDDLRVWHATENVCLQQIHIRFPIFGMLGRMIEHSSYPLHVTTPGGSSVIITCSDFATELYFGELEVSNHIDEETPPTMKKLERNYPFAESATSGGESKNATMEKVTSPLGSDTDDNRFASKSDFTKTLNSTGLALNENHVSVYHYNQVEGKKNGSPLVTNTTSLQWEGRIEIRKSAENSPQMMKEKLHYPSGPDKWMKYFQISSILLFQQANRAVRGALGFQLCLLRRLQYSSTWLTTSTILFPLMISGTGQARLSASVL